jgi:hypothetical protein
MTQTSDPNGAVPLVPGESIGPLRIGMSRRDLSRAGFDVKPDPSGQLGDAVRVVGPYHVVLDGDQVASIEVKLRDLHAGLSVGGRLIPAGSAIEDVTKALPNCGPAEDREGGTVVVCGGGTTLVKAGAHEPSMIEIQIVAAGFLSP